VAEAARAPPQPGGVGRRGRRSAVGGEDEARSEDEARPYSI
jgi:hypothetical protein